MLRYAPLVALIAMMLFIPPPAWGQHAINRRDYIIWRREQTWGVRPLIGDERFLEPLSHKREQVTWEMGKDRSLLIAIWPVTETSTVWMLVSQPSSPHLVKPVHIWDNLSEPIMFWTDEVWVPNELCDPSGCPKIRFQSVRGKVGVRVLDKRGAVTTKLNK